MLLTAKDHLEILPIRFDFTAALGGETISSTTVTAEMEVGGDGNPNDILSGSYTVASPFVTQWVKGGVIDATYRIRCIIITSGSRTLVGSAELPIIKR